MKKFYFLALLLLTISLTVCKADGYQQGFVILKNGKRISGQIKLYNHAPWKNQRYIWFKDSAAVAMNPNVKPKKLYAADMKFYQAGTRQFVKVSYFDQAFIKLRNLYTNSWMLERVANGRFVAYMFYSSPPEFFDYFFADPHGDQIEPVGNSNAMIKYRIIFKKDNAKHFVNAYSYGLEKYFKDTPQILQKYSSGAYGNQPDVDGSIFTRLSEICNRTIFTSHAETNGIIAAFNDYNQIYAPKIEVPKPTSAQSIADLFKPYLFKGTIIDNDSHKGIVGATVSYIDSATQQTVKQTSTDTTGSYVFNVIDKRPFGIKVEKNGFFTQNLTGVAASNGKLSVGNSADGNSLVGGSSNGSGSSSDGATSTGITGGGPSVPGTGSIAANGSKGSGKGTSANGNSTNGSLDTASGTNGLADKHLSARYMRYIHSSRYKHSIYYKEHMQHERELAKQKAASDAAGTSGLLAGNPATSSTTSGNTTGGAATDASATGSLDAANGSNGLGTKHLSARYMRYIHSSRYKHSIYYKEHLQHERELAKQKAASDAAGTPGLLAGSPATGSPASGNTTNGSATGAFADGSSSGSAGSNSRPGNASANGSSSNGGSGDGASSQALAINGKIANGAFVSPDIHLQAYAVNKPIIINNILYDYGYATLRPESINVLNDLVKTMVDNPKVIIELSAHTDSIGSDAYNLKLSQDRAQACVDYMISKGVIATRISAVGYGRSKPIAPNSLPNGQDNPDGRQLNRRTEFVVKQNDKRMTDLTHK
jgi:outer membrane protein OmpA-like peptidoglycan-associated protein